MATVGRPSRWAPLRALLVQRAAARSRRLVRCRGCLRLRIGGLVDVSVTAR